MSKSSAINCQRIGDCVIPCFKERADGLYKALGIVPTNGGQCLLYRWLVQSRLYLSTRSVTCTEYRSTRLSTAKALCQKMGDSVSFTDGLYKALGIVPTNGGQCLLYRWLVQSRLYLYTRSVTCTECRSNRLSTAKALGVVPTNGGQCLIYRWLVQSRLYLSTRSLTCTECRSTRLSTAKALGIVPTNGGQCLLYRWFVQSRLYLSTRSVTCTECRSTRLSTAKALALCQQMGDSVSFTDGLYKADCICPQGP